MNDINVETVNGRPAAPGRGRPDGPNLAVLAVVYGGLTVASLVLGVALAGGGLHPWPFLADSTLGPGGAEGVRFVALLGFGSAVPLVIFAATAYARLLRLGVRVPGPAIGLVGGIGAAGSLAFGACLLWVAAALASEGHAPLAGAFLSASHVVGSVGFASGVGLLLAGIGVPALILRFAPRWLCLAGLVLAAAGEVSFVTLVAEPVGVLVPIVRFAGIAWLVAVAVLLPRRRRAANARGAS